MSHEITIPLSFDFRATKITWECAGARLVGWWEAKKGEVDPLNLIAEVGGIRGKKTFKFPLDRLSKKEKSSCLATIGKVDANEAVKQICTGREPQYFTHSHNIYFTDEELMRHSRSVDAWQMREDFLRLKLTREDVSPFLEKWGRWAQLPTYVDLYEIDYLQRAVRRALTSSKESWFESPYATPPLAKSRTMKFPYFAIVTDSCQEAIRMTTTIDLLRKIKFKTCARPDCAIPFPITSKHERNYCRQYCAHLEAVRRNRKDKANERVNTNDNL